MSVEYFFRLFQILFLFIRCLLGLKSSDFCLMKKSECSGTYDSNDKYKVVCNKLKCIGSHRFFCSLSEHNHEPICSTSETQCQKLKHLKREAHSLRMLKFRLSVKKIYEIRSDTLIEINKKMKACFIPQHVWKPSDMCLNKIKCQEICKFLFLNFHYRDYLFN